MRRSSSALGKDLKTELVDAGASPSAPSPEPTDAGLGADFEAFQASLERECDLALSRMCDDAVESQAFGSLAEDLASQALFDGQMGCNGVELAQAGEPPTLHDGDPWLCFEVSQAEQHCDLALEGMIDLAIDGQSDMVLKKLEDECRVPGALDEMLHDTIDLEEMEGALSRQAEEIRSLCADSVVDAALEEYHNELLSELEMANQRAPCKSLREVIVQHVRRACGLYLLWVI